MSRRLRILYHHRTMARGAEGVHITSIVDAFRAMGHTVDIVSPPGIDPYADVGAAPVDKAVVSTRGIHTFWKWISKHLPNFLFELAEIGYNFSVALRLRRQLRRGNYDLVYERYAFYLFIGVFCARRARVPIVIEANEISGIKRARKQSFPRLCRAFERYIFRQASGVLTVSSFLKRGIEAQGVAAERVGVVPNAIDPARLGTRVKAAALVQQFALSGKQTIGFAGWFDRWDRLELLIGVLEQLRPRFPQLTVLLIGDGPVLNEVRRIVAERALSEHVIYTGAVKRQEVARYLALIDIAVLPHSNEFGSPVIMFEFMALQIPIVAPILDPITDVLTDGVTGMLFPPLNTGVCAAKVAQLLSDPMQAQAIARVAYAKLLRDHTWQQNALKAFDIASLTDAARDVRNDHVAAR